MLNFWTLSLPSAVSFLIIQYALIIDIFFLATNKQLTCNIIATSSSYRKTVVHFEDIGWIIRDQCYTHLILNNNQQSMINLVYSSETSIAICCHAILSISRTISYKHGAYTYKKICTIHSHHSWWKWFLLNRTKYLFR